MFTAQIDGGMSPGSYDDALRQAVTIVAGWDIQGRSSVIGDLASFSPLAVNGDDDVLNVGFFEYCQSLRGVGGMLPDHRYSPGRMRTCQRSRAARTSHNTRRYLARDFIRRLGRHAA